MGLRLLFSEFLDNSQSYFDETKLIGLLKMFGFFLLVFLSYTFIMFFFLLRLKKEIWKTKSMLNMIPTKILLNNDSLKNKFLSHKF